jgi:hypothetical protein
MAGLHDIGASKFSEFAKAAARPEAMLRGALLDSAFFLMPDDNLLVALKP